MSKLICGLVVAIAVGSACGGSTGSGAGGGSGVGGGTGGGSAGGSGGSGGGSAGGSGGSGGGSAGGGGGSGGGSAGGSGGGGGGASDGGLGVASYDLVGGRTHEGHFVATQTQPTQRSADHIRINFAESETIPGLFQSRAISMQFQSTLGSYSCDDAGTIDPLITFSETWTATSPDAGPNRIGQWSSNKPGVSCLVTLTQIDKVDGGAIKGTFSASLPPDTGVPKPDAGVQLMNGTFSVQW